MTSELALVEVKSALFAKERARLISRKRYRPSIAYLLVMSPAKLAEVLKRDKDHSVA